MAGQTLFVFVVDNGWQPDANRYVATSGQWDHTKQSKRAPFDAGLRTPILMRWDGHTQAATHTVPVSSVDLMPTLLAAAGIDASQLGLPGENLWPNAIGDALLAADRCVFGAIFPGDASVLGAPERDLAYRWARQGRYKLIVPHSREGRPPWNRYLATSALYDVISDPGESHNLISDPGLSGTARDLKTQLDRWWSPR
jgi:uncharacterized sulfatase